MFNSGVSATNIENSTFSHCNVGLLMFTSMMLEGGAVWGTNLTVRNSAFSDCLVGSLYGTGVCTFENCLFSDRILFYPFLVVFVCFL